jgi:peptidyl-dipeptidase Dcp
MKYLFFFTFSIIGLMQLNSQINPLFQEWKTPYGVPPFEQVKPEHIMPAFQAAFAEDMADVWAIIRNQEEPDFNNTIVALDQKGALLRKIGPVFGGLSSVANSPELQQIARDLSPIRSKHNDDINLNPLLFERVKAVYQKRDKLNLNEEEMRLLDNTYKGFIRGGAGLPAEKQAKLRKINSELSALQLKFGQNLLAETADFILKVEDINLLKGISKEGLDEAKKRAVKTGNENAWFFGLDNSSIMPFLETAENRELRTQILKAYLNRGNNNNEKDNKEIIEKIVALRMDRAQLMGYENYAEFAIEERMSKNPDIVMDFLNKLWSPSLEMAKNELKDIEILMKKDKVSLPVTPADWRYYSAKTASKKFNIDEEEVKQYFSLDHVRDGIFYVCNKLYGISFTRVNEIPLPHAEATAWECRDKDGSHLGLLYMDMHPRPGQKNGGAWCGGYRSQSYENGNKKISPVVTIACNFTRPGIDKPALLTSDEVNTFFHEFGHALHNLFKDTKFGGTSSPQRDFIEFPSQIMEHWAFHPEVLKVYSRHYKTGKNMPGDLMEKLIKKEQYGQGFITTEFLAASLLDMEYHTLKSVPEDFDIENFETGVLNKYGLIPQIPPRYRSTYFQHSMSGGYTAGYYMYIWAEQLDSDAFEAFLEKKNIFDPELSYKLRYEILSRGGILDAMDLYLNFRGKKPDVDALLRNRGLINQKKK